MQIQSFQFNTITTDLFSVPVEVRVYKTKKRKLEQFLTPQKENNQSADLTPRKISVEKAIPMVDEESEEIIESGYLPGHAPAAAEGAGAGSGAGVSVEERAFKRSKISNDLEGSDNDFEDMDDEVEGVEAGAGAGALAEPSKRKTNDGKKRKQKPHTKHIFSNTNAQTLVNNLKDDNTFKIAYEKNKIGVGDKPKQTIFLYKTIVLLDTFHNINCKQFKIKRPIALWNRLRELCNLHFSEKELQFNNNDSLKNRILILQTRLPFWKDHLDPEKGKDWFRELRQLNLFDSVLLKKLKLETI